MLSDHARDILSETTGEGRCPFRSGLNGEIDATPEAIARYVQQELGAMSRDEADQWAGEARQEWKSEQASQPADTTTEIEGIDAIHAEESVERLPDNTSQAPAVTRPVNPFNPSGKKGKREWTPEQRAEQAERARN